MFNVMRNPAPLLCALLFLGCSTNDNAGVTIALSATPPSVVRGSSVSITLSASYPFFKGSLPASVTSEGGLVLTALVAQDESHATATLQSTAETAVGRHELNIEAGGKTGLLEVTCAAPTAGDGTVVIGSGGRVSSGAHLARLSIVGTGTSFDSAVTARIEGTESTDAIKATVLYVDVLAESVADVFFDVSREQAPTMAKMVLTDGPARYEIPIEIIAAAELASEATAEWLERGRMGWVTLKNASSALNPQSLVKATDAAVQVGMVTATGDGAFRVPVRVPLNYKHNSLELVAESYTEGGSFLELLKTEVTVLDQAVITATPSRIDIVPEAGQEWTGEAAITLHSHGFDLTQVNEIVVEANDQYALVDFIATSSASGTARLLYQPTAKTGVITLLATDGVRTVRTSVVLTDGLAGGGYVYTPGNVGFSVVWGDSFLAPLVVDAELDEESLSFSASAGAAVIGWTWVDTSCVIVEIATMGERQGYGVELSLFSGDEEYRASIYAYESLR